jgi:tRNA modification GTPase
MRARAANFDHPGPHYGYFGQGPVDDVVLARRPNSPTPVWEIHCHGGHAMRAGLIEQLVRAGAEPIPWPEFERLAGRRASDVEILEQLPRATAPRAADLLLQQWGGTLDRAIDQARQNKDLASVARMLGWWDLGRHLVEPWEIVLVGEPNVGKSSLLNAVAGFERAIVSPAAGTTRDLLSVDVSLLGWPFRWIDGAGLRHTSDPIEQEGVDRIRRRIESADLSVRIVDLSTPANDPLLASLDVAADLTVGNKLDLAPPGRSSSTPPTDLDVSAATGQNIDRLIDRVVRRLIPRDPPPGEPIPFLPRHLAELEALRDLLSVEAPGGMGPGR